MSSNLLSIGLQEGMYVDYPYKFGSFYGQPAIEPDEEQKFDPSSITGTIWLQVLDSQ